MRRVKCIIARAKQADKLERQLARECEKRQRLELETIDYGRSPCQRRQIPISQQLRSQGRASILNLFYRS